MTENGARQAVPDPENYLYRACGLRRTFHTGTTAVHAVDGLDLDVAAGEFLAITGPSGSGKSTLLSLLGTLDRATAGTLLFDGRELGQLSPRSLTRIRGTAIGFVFQQFNLIPTLTAAENVQAAGAFTGERTADARRRALALLGRVGLERQAYRLPSHLSGGEQQRVAIARALFNSPKVILADEPTGNLDRSTAGEIVNLLASLRAERGVTVIAVGHSDEVAECASRRVQMRDGRIVDNDG